MFLRRRETIAAAVALEIDRLASEAHPAGEGAAYKAAWDRKGSAAEKHCIAAAVDRTRFHTAVQQQEPRA